MSLLDIIKGFKKRALTGLAMLAVSGAGSVLAQNYFPVKFVPKTPLTAIKQAYYGLNTGSDEIINTAMCADFTALEFKNSSEEYSIGIMNDFENPKDPTSLPWRIAIENGATYNPDIFPPSLRIFNAKRPHLTTMFKDWPELRMITAHSALVFETTQGGTIEAGCIGFINLTATYDKTTTALNTMFIKPSNVPRALYLSKPIFKGSKLLFESRTTQGKNALVYYGFDTDVFERIYETTDEIGDIDFSESNSVESKGKIFWTRLKEPNLNEPNSPYFPHGGRWVVEMYDTQNQELKTLEDDPEISARHLSVSENFAVWDKNKISTCRIELYCIPLNKKLTDPNGKWIAGNIDKVQINGNTIAFDHDTLKNYRFSQGILISPKGWKSFPIDDRKYVPTQNWPDGSNEGYYSPSNQVWGVSCLEDLNVPDTSKSNSDPEKSASAFVAAYKIDSLSTGDPNTITSYGFFGRRGYMSQSASNVFEEFTANLYRQWFSFEPLDDPRQGDYNLDLKVDEQDYKEAFKQD